MRIGWPRHILKQKPNCPDFLLYRLDLCNRQIVTLRNLLVGARPQILMKAATPVLAKLGLKGSEEILRNSGLSASSEFRIRVRWHLIL
jgi:hypothetical protein